MNVGELDVQDTAGTTVLDKGTQIAGKEIKSSELTLKSTSIDDTTAVINDVNKTGKMITFEFDPVEMGTGEANITEKIVMYDGDHFMLSSWRLTVKIRMSAWIISMASI